MTRDGAEHYRTHCQTCLLMGKYVAVFNFNVYLVPYRIVSYIPSRQGNCPKK